MSWADAMTLSNVNHWQQIKGCIGAGIPPSCCPWRPGSCQSSCCHGTLLALNCWATFVARVTPASLEPYQSHHNGPPRTHCTVWSWLCSAAVPEVKHTQTQEELTHTAAAVFVCYVFLLQGWHFCCAGKTLEKVLFKLSAWAKIAM